MTILAAWRDGAGRVNRAPLLLASVWLMTVAISMPLALVLRGMIAQHLGSSMEAERAISGVNYDWMQEFADQASGVGVTFKPTVIGFGAVLDNLNAFLDDVSRPLVIASAASAYVALWLFVAGGILDRYARDRATRAYRILCGVRRVLLAVPSARYRAVVHVRRIVRRRPRVPVRSHLPARDA